MFPRFVEDDSEILFFVYVDDQGKWTVAEELDFVATRLDIVQVVIPQPCFLSKYGLNTSL